MGCMSTKAVIQPPREQTPPPPREQTPPPPREQTPPPPREPSSSSSDDLGKTSDFESFQIQFENDSDEIRIPSTEVNYPPPVPITTNQNVTSAQNIKWFENWDPNTGSDEVIEEVQDEPVTQAQLDSHAKNTPKLALTSFAQLTTYLEIPVRQTNSRDDIMVRAILVWLSHQVVEKFTSEEGTRDTPLGFLSLLGQKRSTYSTFFTLLCRKAAIKCTQVHGVCKAGDYQPGDRNTDDITCLWNAVYINDSWQIIHPYWVCRSVFGKQPGGWIRLEEGGKTIGKTQIEATGVVRNAFKEYYIMPDPQQFVYRCHPDDTQWQLIPTPISRDSFLDQAYLLPPFWALGMQLTSENKCSLKATDGTVTIIFQTPKATANELDLDYDFLLKEGSTAKENENEMLNPANMPRLVTKIRNATEWKFYIQFPVEGTYRLVIYGSPYKQPLLRLCEFEIKCPKRKQDCRLTPFSSGLLGYGPGPACDKAGLLLPSHRNGLVSAEKDKPNILSFLLDSDLSNSLRVKPELIDSNSNKCPTLVKCSIKERELKITTTITKEGDYGLRILTGTCNDEDEDLHMTVVCNYFISTSSKLATEKANKRLARRNLLASIENGEINGINEAIKRCLKEKIIDTDSDIENANRKLAVLLLRKDIHDAKLRRHLETTEKTIQKLKKSVYERIFRETIRQLEALATELQSLHGFTQLFPSVLTALTELNKIHAMNDVVINALRALVILFGGTQTKIENIDDIQAVAREMTHKVRNLKDNSFSLSNARQARMVLDKYTDEETMKANIAAAVICKWVKDVTSEMTN